MKLISFLDRLTAAPAATDDTSRRAVLHHIGRAAATALPVALSAALPAAAAPNDTSYDALIQLLLLERLQLEFYTRALNVTGLIPSAQVADFQRLKLHQSQHTAFLLQALQSAGATVPAVPTFDFSGQHGIASNPVLFPNVLSDYDSFLALAQQLEDLGVRMYKSLASSIVYDAQLFRSALRLHTVEARHSAHIRGLRRDRGAVVKTWPSDTDTPIVRPAAAQALTTAATGGEENTLQYVTAGTAVPFSNFLLIRDKTDVHTSALPEAFDEPLTTAVAQAALNLFS